MANPHDFEKIEPRVRLFGGWPVFEAEMTTIRWALDASLIGKTQLHLWAKYEDQEGQGHG